jgi:hypothetical protein
MSDFTEANLQCYSTILVIREYLVVLNCYKQCTESQVTADRQSQDSMNTYLVIVDRIPPPSTMVWFVDMALSHNLNRNEKLCVALVLLIVAFEFRVTVHFIHCQ